MERKLIQLVPHEDERPMCACTDGICDYDPAEREDVRCKAQLAAPEEESD